MKKIVLSLLIVAGLGLSFTSCGETKEKTEEATGDSVDNTEEATGDSVDNAAQQNNLVERKAKADIISEEFSRKCLKETKRYYENGKPMYIDFLDKETLKKVRTESYDNSGNLIFGVSFNSNGVMDGEFFDLRNEGFYNDGVLTCEDCLLVSARNPSIFTYNYEKMNTMFTECSIKNGAMVGDYTIIINSEDVIHSVNEDATEYWRNQGMPSTYQEIDTYYTGNYTSKMLTSSDFTGSFDNKGVYNGMLTRGFEDNDNLQTLYVENGKVRVFLTTDSQGNVVDSVSNDFKIWKVNYQYIKKPGFPIFSNPGTFSDLPTFGNSPIYNKPISYYVSNSEVILIGGQSAGNLSIYGTDGGVGYSWPPKYTIADTWTQAAHEKKKKANGWDLFEDEGSLMKKFLGIIEKNRNILSSPPGDTGGPNFVLDENGLFTLRALKDKEMTNGEYLYSASDANQFMNMGRAENKNFRTNMYQAYDNFGLPSIKHGNSFFKNYEKILNDSTLNKKQNRYTLSDRVNIFYTLYNILLGDKFLEEKAIDDARFEVNRFPSSLFRQSRWHFEGSYFKNVNLELGSFKEHKPRVFLDIFSGTHKIISIEDYFRGFKKMSEITLKYGDISNSNPREIWVYNNSKENWEKADLSKLIELAILKDKELETRIEEQEGILAKEKEAADLVELELEAANPMGDFLLK